MFESTGVSRREVVKVGAGVAVAAALGGLVETAEAQNPGQGAFTGQLVSPYALVHRITFGYTPSEAKLFDSLGFSGYLEYHLAPEKIDDSAVDQLIANYPSWSLSPYDAKSMGFQDWDYLMDTVEAHTARQILSKRQLYEVMVDLWTDHFNIYLNKAWTAFPPFHQNVIRGHAMGKFPDLLMAAATSGAMMQFLDNSSNKQGNYNENFARELMELHTIGVESGYPEDEVYTVTRCFTGWAMETDSTKSAYAQFKYNDNDHEQYPKHLSFLKLDLAAYGHQNDGITVLNALANHPNTKRMVAKKLIRRFVTYNPPEALISLVVDTYTKTGGDIKAMLRVILTPANLKQYATPKMKRPNHYIASVIRSTNGDFPESWGILDMLSRAGQYPFNWAPPNGYTDIYGNWVTDLLPRWLFAFTSTTNGIWELYLGVLGLYPNRTPKNVVDTIEKQIFGCTLPALRKTQLQSYFASQSRSTNDELKEVTGLAVASPEFQWY